MSPTALNLLRALEMVAPLLVIGILAGVFWPEKRRARVTDMRPILKSVEEIEHGLLLDALSRTSRSPLAAEKITVTGPLRKAEAFSSATQSLVTSGG